MNTLLEIINTYIIGATVPVALILVGIYFSFRLRFFHIFHPIKVFSELLSPEDHCRSGNSPLAAMTVALAGTLGVGNLVGVANAIYLGGVGSVFWMWISAVAAMLLKYSEALLAVSHRRVDRKGKFFGGAMYYIRDIISGRSGNILAFVFSLLCIANSLAMGCSIQVNSAASALEGIMDIPPIITGVFIALCTIFATLGGSRRISLITQRLVPLMSLGFIFISVAVMIFRASDLPDVFGSIFSDALKPQSAVSGVWGFLVSRSVRFGTMRGLMSNEAGCGTAPTAHAESSTDNPVKQGFFGIFEVLADTIILCTMTAVVVILSYPSVEIYGTDGIMMTIKAFGAVLGVSAEYFLSISVLLFALAAIICWCHYGLSCIKYLNRSPIFEYLYIFVYSGVAVYSSLSSPDAAWEIADISLGGMTLINLFVLFRARKEISCLTAQFFSTVQKKRTFYLRSFSKKQKRGSP